MELKYGGRNDTNTFFLCSNRTFMELKWSLEWEWQVL